LEILACGSHYTRSLLHSGAAFADVWAGTAVRKVMRWREGWEKAEQSQKLVMNK